jgi:hypothetical protein
MSIILHYWLHGCQLTLSHKNILRVQMSTFRYLSDWIVSYGTLESLVVSPRQVG